MTLDEKINHILNYLNGKTVGYRNEIHKNIPDKNDFISVLTGMVDEGLLIDGGNAIYRLTAKAIAILERDGWLAEKEREKQALKDKERKEKEESELSREVQLLTRDKLKYEETIRTQKDRIDTLTAESLEYEKTTRALKEQLTFINLLKAYWWWIAGVFAAGGVFAKLLFG